MANYYNYKFRSLSIGKDFRKDGGTVEDLYKLCAELHQKDDSYVMDLYCFVEERYALHHTPHFMFVKDVGLAKAIVKSKFQADMVALPEGQNFISFPKGFDVDGKKAHGVMVCVGSYETRLKWHNHYFNGVGLTPPEYSFANDVHDLGYVSFTHGNPDDPKQVSKLNVPVEQVGDFMAAKTPEDMWEVIQGEQFGAKLNDEELKFQLSICQAAVKVLVYAQAMPEKVMIGIPDNKAMPPKQIYTGSIINPPSGISSNKSGTASPHTVGYFFRQLRHEKYYRGDHKNKPKGSRWVFVEPHERGMTAETIVA